MVGGDAVDGVVEVRPEGGHVANRAQQRPHVAQRPQSRRVGLGQEEMVGRHLARDRQAAPLGVGDQLDLLAAADVDDVNRAVVGGGQADGHGHALLLGMQGDQLLARPGREAGHEGRQVIDAQAAEGVVEVDLQRRRALGQRRQMGYVGRRGPGEQAHVAAGLGRGGAAGGGQGVGRGQRRVGVGHGQHHRDAAGQRGGRARGEGLLVLAAGHAQVGVDVDQAGEGQVSHWLWLLRQNSTGKKKT